jgi:A/G-specific adenine glycosylase
VQERAFVRTVKRYVRDHGRALPWRSTRDPYKILVSEVMLQQTQVSRVVPAYRAFVKVFPTFRSLALAQRRDVLWVWQGLGYNRRALFLQRCAKEVVLRYKGKLPRNKEQLLELPGIGPYTAGAVLVFAHNIPTVMIETNIRTVFLHHFFKDAQHVHDKEIVPLIERTLDVTHPRAWYAALMDYGSHLKATHENPSRRSAHHARQKKFKGSDRELRGEIIRRLAREGTLSKKRAYSLGNRTRMARILGDLVREGSMTKTKSSYRL